MLFFQNLAQDFCLVRKAFFWDVHAKLPASVEQPNFQIWMDDEKMLCPRSGAKTARFHFLSMGFGRNQVSSFVVVNYPDHRQVFVGARKTFQNIIDRAFMCRLFEINELCKISQPQRGEMLVELASNIGF